MRQRNKETTRRRGRTMAAVLTTIALVVALATACVIWRPWTHFNDATDASDTVDISTLKTAEVTRGTLNAETMLGGSLGYDAAAALPAASGVITQLPAVGTVVNTGEQAYEMDGRAVPLFHGSRPFWRTLQQGVEDSPDIMQLEENLAELGWFFGLPDDHFDWYTTDAIRRWQAGRGLTGQAIDGVFQPSQVALAAQAPVRITQITAKLGDTNVSPATYTGTMLHATATVTAAQASQFKPGDKASVILPDNTTVDTTISAVDQGGQPVGSQGQTTQPSIRIDFPDQTQVSSYGATSVRISVPSAAPDMTETLIVPVTALIASANNDYAVEVVRGKQLERIGVEVGRVANARIQLTKAPGLKVGDKVVVS